MTGKKGDIDVSTLKKAVRLVCYTDRPTGE